MSSNPGYHPRNIVPIQYRGYRTCIECNGQFAPEVSTQMMCRLCQVSLSTAPRPKPKSATCHECNQPFTLPTGSNNVKFCGDECRSTARLRQKAAQQRNAREDAA